MKLLKFWMEGCGPCVALSRSLEKVDHPLVKSMENINVDEHPDKAIQYQLRSVPVMLLVDESGTVLKRHNGFADVNQITQFLEV